MYDFSDSFIGNRVEALFGLTGKAVFSQAG
jgi:hypothetical protein